MPPEEVSHRLRRMVFDAKEEGKMMVAREHCQNCLSVPCIWISNMDTMEETIRRLGLVHEHPPNNIMRKYMYRTMSDIISGGPMGEGNRKPLPLCVLEGVRKKFLQEIGEYMGYRVK